MKITFLFIPVLAHFFHEDSAYKYWTIEQGLEWNGGEVVFDDYC